MRKYIIANWKANKTPIKTEEWFTEVLTNWTAKLSEKYEIIVCVPYININVAYQRNADNNIKLGAQDVSRFPSGPYTGEISAEILEGLVTYALIGHSERRQHFFENSEIIAEKTINAVKHTIIPIVCFSDEAQIKDWNTYLEGKIAENDKKNILFAYEPLNAISTGEVGKPEEPETINTFFNRLKLEYQVHCIYGGSVDENNIHKFLTQDTIDGVLVGAASLSSDQFLKVITYAENE